MKNIKNLKITSTALVLALTTITLLPSCYDNSKVDDNKVIVHDVETADNIYFNNFFLENLPKNVDVNKYLTKIDNVNINDSKQSFLNNNEFNNIVSVQNLPKIFISTKLEESNLSSFDKETSTDLILEDKSNLLNYLEIYKQSIKNIIFSAEEEPLSLEETILLQEILLNDIYDLEIQQYCEYELETTGKSDLLNSINSIKNVFDNYLLDKFATKIKNEEYFFDTNNIMLNLLVKFPLLKENNLDNNSINFQTLDYKVKILRESLKQQNSFNFTYTLKK